MEINGEGTEENALAWIWSGHDVGEGNNGHDNEGGTRMDKGNESKSGGNKCTC